MPYTIYDAIKDEIEFLDLLEKVEENEKHTFAKVIVAHQKSSLRRILRRVDSGFEYDVVRDKVDGKPGITYKKTNRKTLEEEYPALKKAAEQYNLMQMLIDATPDDDNGH